MELEQTSRSLNRSRGQRRSRSGTRVSFWATTLLGHSKWEYSFPSSARSSQILPLHLAIFIQIYEHYNFMYDIIDHELMRMGMDFTNLLVTWQRQIASYVDVCAGSSIIIDRPPACKLKEARTGNYVLIWSGLISDLIAKGQLRRHFALMCSHVPLSPFLSFIKWTAGGEVCISTPHLANYLVQPKPLVRVVAS